MTKLHRFPTVGKRLKFVWPLAAAMSLMLSCSLFSSATPTNTPRPTDTSAPLATNTSRPADTPQPSATKKAKPTVDEAGTLAAEQQDTEAAQTGFAGDVLSTVSNTLDTVGENMGAGTVVYWNPDSITVESSKANIISYQLLDSSVQGADFAFHSNITWEEKQKVGIVYCIMMFRISGDLDMDPWYMMRMGRISGAGHILFDVMQNWTFIGESEGDISNYIRVGNGDTNDVLLVARANQFTAYVNGKQVSVWWNTKIDQGKFGFAALQDTGTSVCTFADSWIYDFE